MEATAAEVECPRCTLLNPPGALQCGACSETLSHCYPCESEGGFVLKGGYLLVKEPSELVQGSLHRPKLVRELEEKRGSATRGGRDVQHGN